jgi:hypothetical protein
MSPIASICGGFAIQFSFMALRKQFIKAHVVKALECMLGSLIVKCLCTLHLTQHKLMTFHYHDI